MEFKKVPQKSIMRENISQNTIEFIPCWLSTPISDIFKDILYQVCKYFVPCILINVCLFPNSSQIYSPTFLCTQLFFLKSITSNVCHPNSTGIRPSIGVWSTYQRLYSQIQHSLSWQLSVSCQQLLSCPWDSMTSLLSMLGFGLSLVCRGQCKLSQML